MVANQSAGLTALTAPLLLLGCASTTEAASVNVGVVDALAVLPASAFTISSLSSLDGALNSFAFAVPSSGSHVFGMALHGDAVSAKECWVEDASRILEGIPSLAGIGHPFLAGRCKSSLGGWVMLMVALMPPPPTMPEERGSAFDYSPPFLDTLGIRWVFPVELESSPASFIVSLASSRLRYMIAPSPPLPLALEVGTEALAKVAYEKLDYVRSHFGSALAACELANGELAACLRSTDRGIPSYRAFLKKCLTTIAPLPAASIPSQLQDMCYEVDHARVARLPFEHGTSIPDTRPLPPRPSPPRLSAVPQRDEDIYTESWLSLVDAKLLDIQEWHSGRRNKRPTPLYGGLETILPHLRPFFAAGGVLDMRGGVGSVIDMRDSPDYASSWNLPFVNVMLAKSKDRQIRDLWCDGIDMLDDLHWDAESSLWVWRPLVLNGVCANLLSAYGLEKNGPTSSPESQNVSDRVATELASFIANDPPLYSAPTIVGSGMIGSRLRFQTAPWCNYPIGQVPKKGAPTPLGEPIRIIINMSNPPTDSNAKTLSGEVVLSLNVRSAIHPPKDSGFLQPDWKHTLASLNPARITPPSTAPSSIAFPLSVDTLPTSSTLTVGKCSTNSSGPLRCCTRWGLSSLS